LVGARGRELFLTPHVLLSQDRDDRAGERFTLFVQHVARDDPAARELDVDVGRLLSVGQLDGCAGPRRPALTKRAVNESRLRRGDCVCAGGTTGDLKAPLFVGAGGTRTASAADNDAGTAQCASCISGNDLSRDRRRPGGRCDVPWRCRSTPSAGGAWSASLSTPLSLALALCLLALVG
jgi:hypothetical protein